MDHSSKRKVILLKGIQLIALSLYAFSTEVINSINELIHLLQKMRDLDAVPAHKIDAIQDQTELLKKELSEQVVLPKRKKAGFAKHMISYVAADFDAPLDDMYKAPLLILNE